MENQLPEQESVDNSEHKQAGQISTVVETAKIPRERGINLHLGIGAIILAAVVGIVLLAGAFSGGIIVGWYLPHKNGQTSALIPDGAPEVTLPQTAGSPYCSGSETPEELKNLFDPFWETWNIVQRDYVDQPVDNVEMMRGAIRGMLASLGDQHTSYMDPEEYATENDYLQQEYEGIGAWVDITGDYLKIISPMSDSPAEKAGIKAGDLVIAVDGVDMTGMDGELVLRRIKGPAGSEVKLTLRREGLKEALDVTIRRERIRVPSIEAKMLDNNIAYIQLATFGEKSDSELHKALEETLAKKPSGLILDLRNNGGGYLDVAINIVSEFIDEGEVVMYERMGNGNDTTFKSRSGGLATKIPLVVLVNEGTASAAEITAGAIQDYARGELVGMTTYGKGSVQNWIPLANEQGAVRVTIARWFTPKEQQIHKVGLKPDVEIQFTEEDIKNNKDVQLDKAIEILLKKLK